MPVIDSRLRHVRVVLQSSWGGPWFGRCCAEAAASSAASARRARLGEIRLHMVVRSGCYSFYDYGLLFAGSGTAIPSKRPRICTRHGFPSALYCPDPTSGDRGAGLQLANPVVIRKWPVGIHLYGCRLQFCDTSAAFTGKSARQEPAPDPWVTISQKGTWRLRGHAYSYERAPWMKD